MNQPIKLQLNAEAIEALFPEGTQARIELQNAVVAEFTRKHLRDKALGDNVQAQIERARADALDAVKRAKSAVVDQALTEIGAGKNYNGVYLSDTMKREIAEQARRAVRDEIAKDVTEHVQAAAANLKAQITESAQSAVSRLLDTEIRAAVKARVAAVVEGLSHPAAGA
jgi:hypothetical protein